MKNIDERVVSMKFNNDQFQKGVQDTTKSLENLKKGLNLDGATKGIQDLDAAGRKFSLAGMASGVEGISAKFIALSTIAITALTNITNRAIDAGARLVKSFTVAPIMDGFREYELKMGSIQTILANTARHGTGLKEVTASLDELNTYADKTIYNFGDMTRNIGLFTNAGLKVEEATSMIKGFSNEAAASGTSSQGAAGAAYQLSQALSAGKITLMDWRSLTNVGMGNKNMQNSIIEIAEAMGTLNGKGVTAKDIQTDFNSTLEKGWLTADVMSSYLQIMAGDMDAAAMSAMGLSDETIEGLLKQQKTAEEAATKVRTLTGLMDTLKEAVGSGWAATFDILFGDFNEATDLFTAVSQTVGGAMDAMGNARNDLLKSWDALGGRAKLIDAIANVWKSLVAIFGAVGDAFREIFPPATGEQLLTITEAIQRFTQSLIPGQATLQKFKIIARGVFSILDIGWMVIKGLAGVFGDLFGAISGGSGSFLDILSIAAQWVYRVRTAIKEGEGLSQFFSGLSVVLQLPIKFLKLLIEGFKEFFSGLKDADFSGVSDAVGKLTDRLNPLEKLGGSIAKVWSWTKDVFADFVDFVRPLGESLGRVFGGLGEAIGEAFRTLDFSGIMDIFNTGLLAGLVLMVRKFFKGGFKKEVEDGGGGIVDSIKKIFGGVTDTLDAMQTTLKAGTLVMIASAIALLTASVLTLSLIDSGKLAGALTALAVMFGQLMVAMLVFDKIAVGSSVIKMQLLAAAMIPLSVAILILSAAVKSMADLDWNELAKGLTGVVVLLGALAGTAKLMSGHSGGLISASLAMIAVGAAVKILASAVKDFSDLSWGEMIQGLVGVGAVLGALTLFTRLAAVNKGAVAQATGLILLGAALKIMASAVGDFADMDVPKMLQGLGAITAVLGILTGFSALTKGAKGMVGTAASMVILGGALKIMASALGDFADLSWDELIRGFVGMGGALVLIAGAMLLMPPTMILTATGLVVVAGALKIIASAMQEFGGMTWDEIGRGLVVLAGSLAILAGAMALMGIPLVLLGSIGILAAAAALAMLAPAMVALGGMEWDEIGRGLTMLASTLGILALAGILILPAIPGLLLLGGAIVLLGVGTMAAGVGVLAFATALGLLTVAGAAGTATLVAMGSALIGLIPEALTALAEGIIGFIGTLVGAAPQFLNAAVTLFSTLLQAVNILAPQIINTLMTLIWLLVDNVVAGVPRFVDAGMRLLLGILNGIANNIGRVVTAATSIIVNFLNGISQNMPRITNAGADLIISFVNSMANTVRTRSADMRAAGQNLAMAIADGMTGGLASRVGDLANSAANLAKSAISAAKSALGINSPSKVFYQIGAWTAEGAANGLSKYGHLMGGAAKTMAVGAIDTVRSTLSRLGDMVQGDMDINPTITPVLDLSQVEKDSKRLGSMLPSANLALDGTASLAAMAQDESDGPNDEERPGGGDDEPKGDVYNFNQYNNSPKALSKADIYRQTRNQLSVVKKGGLVKT